MKFYLVTQKPTFEQEIANGYLWKRKTIIKNGKNGERDSPIKNLKKGDVLFHNNGNKNEIAAISYVIEDSIRCHLNKLPEELQQVYMQDKNAKTDDGYYVSVNIEKLANPIQTKKLLDFSFLHGKGLTYDNGNKIEGYLLPMTEEEVIYTIGLYDDAGNIGEYRWKVLEEFGYESVDSYNHNDHTLIEDTIKKDNFNKWMQNIKNYYANEPKEADIGESDVVGRRVPKRKAETAAEALAHAAYKCEYDGEHHTFTRKNGKQYTEPHHLVPLSKTCDFPFPCKEGKYISLDVTNNIISLCSHCHNLLHYGCMEEKELVLAKLYKERQKLLEDAGIKITFEELKKYYS